MTDLFARDETDETLIPAEHVADALPPINSVARMAAALRAQESRIVANWAVRVSTLPTFRANPDIALDDLQRHIPELLNAALTALATSDPDVDPEPIERATAIAAAHGATRRREDVAISVMIAEFYALRSEIWNAAWRLAKVSPTLIRHFDVRLSETFFDLVGAAAEAWVATAPAVLPSPSRSEAESIHETSPKG